MTNSARHRMTRNAEEIAALIVRWPVDERQTDTSVQHLAPRHLPLTRLDELRSDGINWQLVAERVNRTIDDEAPRKPNIIFNSGCYWCGPLYQGSVAESNRMAHITRRVA